ncbi:hypothetical protein M23134_05884 [Microscilla marina ATCC 23134]|uniref:Co-chaperone DjlA N-terminal domain-containing protein n=2 Tax=Microscilla marina TaxID=1027 RepID=A1ZWT7_MICM2|nr:hypothetical protein M23134_05884 [Microscilla marina ATCC 23134]
MQHINENRKGISNALMVLFFRFLMKFNSIRELYQLYFSERPATLDVHQFTLLVEFFPTVLVVLSDGVLDDKEKTYIKRLAASVGNIFMEDGYAPQKAKELAVIFGAEFEYLIHHQDEWKDQFLSTLNAHLERFPEQKDNILDTIYLFAEASQDLQSPEKDMILFLKDALNLEENIY